MTGTAIFLAVVLIGAIILFAVISSNPHGRRRRGGSRGGYRAPAARLDRAATTQRWTTIQTMATTGGGNGLRAAVMEADKLFDHVMRSSGISGATMGDRLKSARNYFSDYGIYDGVWRAHKLRNALAHEVGFDLVPSQAHDALRGFERGLKELGAI